MLLDMTSWSFGTVRHFAVAFLTAIMWFAAFPTTVRAKIVHDDDFSKSDDAFSKYNFDSEEGDWLKPVTETDAPTDWKPWSAWSDCSRTCDGGATFQYRTCFKEDGSGRCFGEKVRYRLCNTQACPSDSVDFRVQQCTAYNNLRYKGKFFRWIPEASAEKPCALTCRSTEDDIVREMTPNVLDRTRCREGSLDMCINGICMPVGCDLKLGSSLKLDACGVCGGDGTLCGKPAAFTWKESSYSTCSRPCGGGYQSTSSYCVNINTGGVVADTLCDISLRPVTQIRECNKHPCTTRQSPKVASHNKNQASQYQWATESWGPCTVECSGGSQARKVYCLETLRNGTKVSVGDYYCSRTSQPPTGRRCNSYVCPEWQTSSWSPCSATCGRGSQVRTVKCVDHKGFDSDVCDKSRRPTEKKVCKATAYCTMDDSHFSSLRPEDRPHSEQALPLVAPQSWNEHPITDEDALKYEDSPMFAIGPWSECSATCGHGYRHRSVECKLYIRFSVKLIQLPDSECSDPRPVDREPCSRRPCEDYTSSYQNSTANYPYGNSSQTDQKLAKFGSQGPGTGIEVTYSWHYEGYTGCSKTCLGGTRQAIIRCFRDHDQSPVDEKFCKLLKRPPELKQACNEIPCPPRWNTSDFTTCSRSCGGGTQTRTVQCVQELGAAANDVLPLPGSSCSYPPPRTHISCANSDCAPQWDVGQFGPCSRTCGKGLMERSVVCRQRMASGDVQDFHVEGICPKQRPSPVKSCFLRACPPGTPTVEPRPESFNQPVTLHMSKTRTKASKIKVGGSAVLYEGTDLRLKCPVTGRPSERPLVSWLKDGKPVHYSKSLKAHVKMSALGAIKIRSLRKTDAGTYTCIAGKVRESIHLTVVGRATAAPAHSPSSSNPLFIGNNGNTIQRFYANSTDALRILQSVSQKTTPFSNAIFEGNDINGLDVDKSKYFSDQDIVTKSPDDGKMEDFTMPPQLLYTGTGTLETNMPQVVVSVLDMFQQPRGIQQIFVDQSGELSQDGQRITLQSRSGQSKLVVEWVVGEWSACSRSCGGAGSQVRSLSCQAVYEDQRQVAQHALCLMAGLRNPPDAMRTCGWNECPEWTVGSWENCERGTCFAIDTAIQTRNVTCAFSNGTAVDNKFCQQDIMPRQKRDCVNHNCKAEWTTGPWSECTLTCGSGGIRSRILKCVVSGTSKPAGNMCRGLDRPTVKELCPEMPKCDKEDHCRDHFKYCDYANSLKLCRQKAYRLRCCRTCNAHQTIL